MLFNIPINLRNRITDSDRAFNNKVEQHMNTLDISERYTLRDTYEIIWCGILWKMSIDNKLKFKKTFKQCYLELTGEEYGKK